VTSQESPPTPTPRRLDYLGWLLWVGFGAFLIYRALSGIAKYHTLTLVAGVAATAIGLIMLAMNAIEGLRPWRKPVAIVLILTAGAAMAVYNLTE
jgi:hypothetical protein